MQIFIDKNFLTSRYIVRSTSFPFLSRLMKKALEKNREDDGPVSSQLYANYGANAAKDTLPWKQLLVNR